MAVEREGEETSLQDLRRGAQPAPPYSWVTLPPAELASNVLTSNILVKYMCIGTSPCAKSIS